MDKPIEDQDYLKFGFTEEEMNHLENFNFNPNYTKDRLNKVEFKAFNETITYLPANNDHLNNGGKDIYELFEEIDKKDLLLDDFQKEHNRRSNEADLNKSRIEIDKVNELV